GLVAALALRTNRPRENPPESAIEHRTGAAAPPAASAGDGTEVEIELADPGESGFAQPERGAPVGIATEKDLVDAMRASFQSEPEKTITLAELGENRFGESPRALERRLYEIK